MDQRTPLSQGASVRQFVVDKIIGGGASCLVYEAHFLDSCNNRKEIILKECYPYNAGTARVGNKIIWSNPAEQEKAFLRFNDSYEVAAKIQNMAGAQSVSVYSLDKFEENGTQYVATIPNGNSYDKTKTNDLADIIRTALALTNAVGRYHKAGYLHLDIKPSNFIATEDQTGKGKNIVLFDVDTVAAQEDIRNGSLRTVSYSNDYAAPEQKLQQIKKICPATDLFAVGAVLFERIMKRPVKSFDSGLFATWEYDSRFDVKRVNPKAKRLLTEIFHKTLAANVKRRYQSADDLARALSELCDVIESNRPYIFTPRYVSTCNFVGRSEELAELHKALADGKPVFVNGAGGIGKTELVKKYVSLHQDEYDAVVFILYNGSVSECLNEIEIIGIDSEDKDNKSLLKEICDENVLLILDNYDVAPNESKGLDELFDLNCKIIVTTRTDFSERNPNAHFIEVSGLSPIALRVVFENESGLTLSDSEFEDMQTILHIGQECTYFWSMIARLAKEGAYSVSEIVEKVNTGLDDLEDSEDVFDTKDGNNINTTVATAMLILFRLDELTDKDFEVLKAMYFLDCLNMGKRQIKEMLAFSTNKLMNFFNALVKKGYIQRLTVAKYEVYRISDVLRNVLEYKEELDISENRIATAFIDEKLYIDKVALNDPTIRYRLYVKDQANNTLICLFKILSGLNWDISGNALYSIDKMYRLFAGESLLFRYAYESCVLTIIKNIVRIYRKEISLITRVKINIIIIAWFCFDIMICQSDYQCEIAKIIEDSFYEVLSAMEKINIDNSEAMDNLCKPITALFVGFTTLCNCFSANIIKTILSINPPCIKEESVDTVLRSFRINCLKNNKYEKEYLKSTLEKIEKANDSDKVRISYLSIGLIALNGEDVSIKIDEELKVLRDRVLDVCRDVFFNGTDDTKPNLVKVNIFDFLPNIARSETQRAFEIMSIGLSRFILSIHASGESFAEETVLYDYMDYIASINDYPSFKDKNDHYCIDLFLSSMDSIDSSNSIYYFISEFRYSLWRLSECTFELSESEKQKYVKVAKELEKRLCEIKESGLFVEIIDGHSKDYYEVKADLKFAAAIMYNKFGNYDKAYKYWWFVIEHMKRFLNTITADDLVTEKSMQIWDFLWLSNEYLYGQVVVPPLYSLIESMRTTFNVTDEADERLYRYYKSLVRAAERAKKEVEKNDDITEFLFDTVPVETEKGDTKLRLFSTKQDYEGLIEKYTKLIEQISGQKYHPQRSFRP